MKFGVTYPYIRPIPMAVLSKVWICGSSCLLVLRGSIPAGSIDACHLRNIVWSHVEVSASRWTPVQRRLTESRLSPIAKPRKGRPWHEDRPKRPKWRKISTLHSIPRWWFQWKSAHWRRRFCYWVLLLSSLSLSLSPLYRIFTRVSPRQTMSLGDTLLQLLFRFIVSTVYGAYLPRSYVGSDGLLRQHFPENVCSA